VRLLVGGKASLNSKNGAGLTPAQLAVREDHLDVVGFLTRQGCASPDVLLAASAGNADHIRALLRQDATLVRVTTKARLTPLHLAAHFGQAEAAERLLESGAKVEATTTEGLTALHIAAATGQEAVARVLLRFKAPLAATPAWAAAPASWWGTVAG
jgi:ankyrin